MLTRLNTDVIFAISQSHIHRSEIDVVLFDLFFLIFCEKSQDS